MNKVSVVMLAVLLAACSHKEEAQTSSNNAAPDSNQAVVAPASAPVQQVALRQDTGSGDVISSTNLAFGKKGANGQPQSYFDNYDQTFVRNFASMTNVDQVALARLALPDFWKENNAFKQQDIIKANADKLKALSWGHDGLVAVTVDNGAVLRLTDPATGTYTIDFQIYNDQVNSAGGGVSFNRGSQRIAREYHFETMNDNGRLPQVVKKVGEDKARQIEDVVGGARDQGGNVQLPVTLYVRMKKGVVNVSPQQSYAYIVADIDHADIDWGDVQGVKHLVTLSHDELYPAQGKAKGGTPSSWY